MQSGKIMENGEERQHYRESLTEREVESREREDRDKQIINFQSSG